MEKREGWVIMSRVVGERVAALLAEAEGRGSCYVPCGEDADRVRHALLRRVAAGEVVSPAPGLFVSDDTWRGLKRDSRVLFLVRGLQEAHPDWVFCGPTAALVWGLDVSFSLLDRVHLAVTPQGRGSDRGLVMRHGVLAPEATSGQIEEVGGVRVTPPKRTVFDCLRWTDFPRGLGIADSALRTGVASRSDLEAFFMGTSPRLRGRDLALSTLSWADGRSENGGESIVRGRMLLLGYVCPELQVEVPRVVETGRPYRVDFCWVRADGRVILSELDGDGKYVEEELMGGRGIDEVLSDENIRGSRFTLYDVSMLRFRFKDTNDPVVFSALLDEYGVPRRGSELALPDGTRMIPNWNELRRDPAGGAVRGNDVLLGQADISSHVIDWGAEE